MNKFNASRGILPHEELRTIRRSVKSNEDLQLPFRIVQRQTIEKLFLNCLALVICRDDDAYFRFPIFLLYRPPYDFPQQSKQRRIPDVYICDETEAEPEDQYHRSTISPGSLPAGPKPRCAYRTPTEHS